MMIMKRDATEEDIKQIVKEIRHYGLKADISRGDFRTVIGLVGDERRVPFDNFCREGGCAEVLPLRGSICRSFQTDS